MPESTLRTPGSRLAASTLSLVALLLAIACAKGDTASRDTATASGALSESTSRSGEPRSILDDAGEEVETYRLTMDKVNRFYDAFRDGTIAAGNRAESDTLEDVESIDEIVKQIEREPKVAAAVKRAGLSVREYIVMTFALMNAGLANEVLKMQPTADVDSLARELEVPAANIRFVREHSAEIEAKANAAKAAVRAAGVNID